MRSRDDTDARGHDVDTTAAIGEACHAITLLYGAHGNHGRLPCRAVVACICMTNSLLAKNNIEKLQQIK